MSSDDEWDTSGEVNGSDPFNRSQFGGGAAHKAQPKQQQHQQVRLSRRESRRESHRASGKNDAQRESMRSSRSSVANQGRRSSTIAKVTERVKSVSRRLSGDRPTPAPAAAPAAPMDSKPRRSFVQSFSRRGSRAARQSLVPDDAPDFLKEVREGESFIDKLSPEALEFFNEVCNMTFAGQAVSFLNAYWNEVGDQAEFIFSVAYPIIRYADMHAKGINYIHLYDEGNMLDFNIGLYFYEKLCKTVLDEPSGAKWRNDPEFEPSIPEMMTAIKRKVELREKVDVNFDGHISMIEYLLYQYREFANPADFTFRAMKTADVEEHPEIVKARQALEDVNDAIRKYEAERHRLQELSKQPGVKGLGGKHQLAILHASPLAEKLNEALIHAEAAVRIATKKFGSFQGEAQSSAEVAKPTAGSMWWMNRDLQEKKRLYGRMN